MADVQPNQVNVPGKLSPNENITILLRVLTIVEVIVLLGAGLGLLLLPLQVVPLWAWNLTPFNTRFTGALYTASLFSALMLVINGKRQLARLVVPQIFLFTLTVLIISILYSGSLDWQRFATRLWFVLYTIIPLNALYHLWLYRNLQSNPEYTVTGAVRTILMVNGTLWGAYGLAMLIFGSSATAFWPWKLDDFHARLYSVAALTPALGNFLLARSAAPVEWFTLGLSEVVAGFTSLLGLLLANGFVPPERQVNLSNGGTWLWICICIYILLAGIWTLWMSRHRLQSQSSAQ